MTDAPPPTTSAYGLLYRSTASRSLSAGELLEMITHAEDENARHGVTGLLLHGHMAVLPGVPGAFVQWIEGDRDAVDALYERIRSDSRHTDVETLAQRPVREMAGVDRLFPNWSMRLEEMADLPATLSGFLRYVEASRRRWAEAA